MPWIVQLASGDFVGISGVTNFVSEALSFDVHEDAIRRSVHHLRSRVVEIKIESGSEYVGMRLRESENFVDHVASDDCRPMTPFEKCVRDVGFNLLGIVLVFAAIGMMGCGGGSTAIVTPPAANDTVQITSQPQSLSVVAPAPAQFAVGATAPNGESINYQWTATAPGTKTPVNIGTNSSTLTIDPTSLSESGTMLTVAVSSTADPVSSAPAVLTVSETVRPPVTPAFASATPFPYCNQPTGCPTNPTPGIFTVNVPSVAGGIAVVCFNYNGTQTQIPEIANANGIVTDSANDNFTLLNYLPLSWLDFNNFEGCFGAQTAGGSISFSVNMTSQTATNTASIEGVVLNYAGAYSGIEVEALNSSSGTTNSGGTVFDSGSVTFTNSRLLIVMAATDGAGLAAGANWTQRYLGGGNILVEDQIVTSGSTVNGESYLTNLAPDCNPQQGCSTAYGAAIMAVN